MPSPPDLPGWQQPSQQPHVPHRWQQQPQQYMQQLQHAQLQRLQLPYSPMVVPPHTSGMQNSYAHDLWVRMQFDKSLMGPPPAPQKSAASAYNGSSATLAQTPQLPILDPSYMMPSNPMIYPTTSVAPEHGTPSHLPQSDIMPPPSANASTVKTPRQSVPNSLNKIPMSPSLESVAFSEMPRTNNSQSLPIAQRPFWNPASDVLNKQPLKSNDVQHPSDIDRTKLSSEARLFELLNGTSLQNDSNMAWPFDSALKKQFMAPDERSAASSNASLTQPAPTPPQSSSIPHDLKNVQPTMFTNNELSFQQRKVQQNEDTSSVLPPANNPITTPPSVSHSLPAAGDLPGSDSLLPPMAASGQQSQFSDQFGGVDDPNDKDKPKRRRRKRCGACDPCQRKEDCGLCYVCKNKGQVNAICKSRKCLLLRKKVGSYLLLQWLLFLLHDNKQGYHLGL